MTDGPMTDGERWHAEMGEIARLIAAGEWDHRGMRKLRRIELAERSLTAAHAS